MSHTPQGEDHCCDYNEEDEAAGGWALDSPWEGTAAQLDYRGSRTHWRQKDGRLIRPKDMTDSHLLNTIHLIHRNHVMARCWGALLYEAGRRGLKPNVPEAQP